MVADLYCLLRLELELAVQPRALLMAREAGLTLPPDEDLRMTFDEITYIQHSIGPSGLLALRPLSVTTHRDRWHRHLLEERYGRAGGDTAEKWKTWKSGRSGKKRKE